MDRTGPCSASTDLFAGDIGLARQSVGVVATPNIEVVSSDLGRGTDLDLDALGGLFTDREVV